VDAPWLSDSGLLGSAGRRRLLRRAQQAPAQRRAAARRALADGRGPAEVVAAADPAGGGAAGLGDDAWRVGAGPGGRVVLRASGEDLGSGGARARLRALVAAERVAWGVLSDGRRFRLQPAGALFRHLEVDLAAAGDDPRAPGVLVTAFAAGTSPGAQGSRLSALRRAAAAAARAGAGAGALDAAGRTAALERALAAAGADARWLDAAALGALYEEVLAAGGAGRRRRQGSFYTPAALVRTANALALDPVLAAAADPAAVRILDPAVGGGLFLLDALDAVARALLERGAAPDLVGLRRRVAPAALAGCDRDPAAVALARGVLARATRAPGRPDQPLPRLLVGDALLGVDGPVAPDGAATAAAARFGRGLAAVDRATAAADDAGLGRAAARAAAARAALDAALEPVVRSAQAGDDPGPVVHWRALFPAGFDAVVGNPPWHRELAGRDLLARVRRADLGRHARSKADLWTFFSHLALDLLRPGGRHAFVTPGYWLQATGPGPAHLRRRLRDVASWRALVDLGALRPFGRVAARTVVFCVARGEPAPVVVLRPAAAVRLEDLPRAAAGAPVAGVARDRVPPEAVHGPRGEVLLERPLDEAGRALLGRLQGGRLPAGWRLSEGVTANPERLTARALERVRRETGVDLAARGAAPGDPVFVVPRGWPPPDANAAERALLVPFLRPEEVPRLRAAPGPETPWLIYATPASAPTLDGLPALRRHLEPARPLLELRRETRRGRRAWFHLHWPRDPAVVRAPRVLVPRMVAWPRAAVADAPAAVGESVYVLVPPEPAWCRLAAALLNALPFAVAIALTTKRRGKGIDVPRAALAGCPWPAEATFAAAAAGAAEGPAAELAEAGRLADALAERTGAAAHDGPWWEHADARVRDLGRGLDEAACRLAGVPYPGLRALAERARGLRAGAGSASIGA